MKPLVPRPLTADAFRPFGEVIDVRAARSLSINDGLTERFHDLATVDVAGDGARVLINVFRSQPIALPHRVQRLERHPLGSQAFVPTNRARILVLVALGDTAPDPRSVTLFVTDGEQGVNYARNTWHHYQLVLDEPADFIVVDRGGPGNNLEEADVSNLSLVIDADSTGLAAP